jgi:protein-L-isoaspartate(D-aspartate) O-methyltransferase
MRCRAPDRTATSKNFVQERRPIIPYRSASTLGFPEHGAREMDREQELEVIRRAYAKQIMAEFGVVDARVEAAFSTVRREHFLGAGPWPVLRWGRGYVTTPSDDPVYLYTNHVIGILPERNLNNGEPSLHAHLIANANPQTREHVVHVGAGVGYYTAILAELVGDSGSVTAIELDPSLAERAKVNLAHYPNVRVVQGNGVLVPFDRPNVIYVNAGATRPVDRWLDALKEGGRLILPLTALPARDWAKSTRRGGVFRIERRGSEFFARWISYVAIFPCEGARDAASEAALAEAFDRGGGERVTRLYRHNDIPEEYCWLRAPEWCLTYDSHDVSAPTLSRPS